MTNPNQRRIEDTAIICLIESKAPKLRYDFCTQPIGFGFVLFLGCCQKSKNRNFQETPKNKKLENYDLMIKKIK